MITELGQFFFRFGIAFTVISTFLVAVMLASGMQVPEILQKASALASLLTGDMIRSVGSIISYAGLGLGFLAFISAMRTLFSGGMVPAQLFQPLTLAVYLTLSSLAIDGCVTSLSMLIDFYTPLLGTPAHLLTALKGSILTFITFTISYYIVVRAFGAPAE